MALKTVSKLNLSKNAPLSIELETALITDQSVIKDVNTLDVEYIDNTLELPNKEEERLKALIGDCTSIADLEKYRKDVYDSFPVLIDDFETKFSELSEKEA
jgi:recombinational DNA repair protein RecT